MDALGPASATLTLPRGSSSIAGPRGLLSLPQTLASRSRRQLHARAPRVGCSRRHDLSSTASLRKIGQLSKQALRAEAAPSQGRTPEGTFDPLGIADVQKGQSMRSLQAILGVQGALALGAVMAFVPGLDLEGPGSVLEAMAVLALIVTVHEAGHFSAARLLGIHVSKFAIGFGPTIFKYEGQPEEVPALPAVAKPSKAPWLKLFGGDSNRSSAPAPGPRKVPGVEYSLRLIPLGGYVAFPDDDENDTTFAADDPDLLKNRPVLDRIIVVSAGVVANFIFAYSLLFAQVNTVGLVYQQFQPGVSVPKVIPGGAGEQAGLRDGDVIIQVEGRTLAASDDAVTELVGYIKERPGQLVKLVVERNSEMESLTVKPTAAPDGTGRINVQLQPNIEAKPFYPRNFVDGALLAWSETIRLGSLVTDGLRQLFMNFGEAAEKLSGPVAIVAVGAEVARTSTSGLFQFAAIVNLNLAVVNILPLPALDGGFLVLLLIEAARGGKKLPQDLERAIMSSGLLLLLTAGVILIVRDTLNLAAFL